MSKPKTDSLGRKNAGGVMKGINLEQLEALCSAQCTIPEIAAFFKLNEKTIRRHSKTKAFIEIMERGKASGRCSLRRAQMKLAMSGDRTMLIWLGKQWLDQSDKAEHTGKDGAPLTPPSWVVVLPGEAGAK